MYNIEGLTGTYVGKKCDAHCYWTVATTGTDKQ